MELILPPSLLLYYTRSETSTTAASPEIASQHVANIHWFDIDVSTPTKSHPLKFNYCDLFFAVPSALTKFAKVKFTQNIIALRYFEGGVYCAQSYQFCSYYLRALSNLCSEDFE